MVPCLVIGDSIAAGVHRAMPECEARVIGGSSAAVFDSRISTTGLGEALVTVISLGSNEGPDGDQPHLLAIRGRLDGVVVWLLPPGRPIAREVIVRIAAAFNDRIVDVLPPGHPAPGDATTRHIHPSAQGDLRLAQRIRSAAR
jgi:hypothetical protein